MIYDQPKSFYGSNQNVVFFLNFLLYIQIPLNIDEKYLKPNKRKTK